MFAVYTLVAGHSTDVIDAGARLRLRSHHFTRLAVINAPGTWASI